MDNQKAHSDIRLIGVGNEFRRDDGIGIFIVRHQSLKRLDDIQVLEERGEATNLVDSWKDGGNVFLFDAVSSGNTPGTVYRFNARKEPLPRDLLRVSTHTFGVAEGIELSRASNRLPIELIVFGIEGENFGWGKGLSSAVERAALEVIRRVLKEIRELRKGELRLKKSH